MSTRKISNREDQATMTFETTIMMGPHTKLREALETDDGRAILGQVFDA
jgi:hypothetical protein